MNEQEIHKIVKKQRAYFCSGATLSVDFRLGSLEKLEGRNPKKTE